MRITKSIAEQISNAVAKDKYGEQITAIRKQRAEVILKEHDAFYPKEVIDLLSSSPHFFDRNSVLYWTKSTSVDRYLGIHYAGERPILRDFNQDRLSTKAIKTITELCFKDMNLHEESNKLKKEIANALIACGTYKKVSENLPKLVGYLPKIEKTEVMIDFKKINQSI
jgi:hypothetical protein